MTQEQTINTSKKKHTTQSNTLFSGRSGGFTKKLSDGTRITQLEGTSSQGTQIDCPYSCNKCRRKFQTSQGLASHKRTHARSGSTNLITSMFTARRPEVEIRHVMDALVDSVVYDAEKKKTQQESTQVDIEKVDGRTISKVGGRKQRLRYTFKKKATVLELFDRWKHQQPDGAQARVAEYHQIDASQISRWNNDRVAIFENAAKASKKKLFSKAKIYLERKYKTAEYHLYILYKKRRSKGLKVSPRWLSSKMRKLVQKYGVSWGSASNFRASESWRTSFRREKKISIRQKTNTKQHDKKSRHETWRRFHFGLMALKATNLERDPRHGKYRPNSIYSEDQVPLPFYNGGTSTYADRGSVDVRMAMPSGDMDKRFATFHMCFRFPWVEGKPIVNVLDPDPMYDFTHEQPPQVIIFKGAGFSEYANGNAKFPTAVS